MHQSNFIFFSRWLSSFHAIYWPVYFFLHCLEVTPLPKFLGIFGCISVLSVIFLWSVQGPMAHYCNYWSYIKALISGNISPFTLQDFLVMSISLYELQNQRIQVEKKTPTLCGILFGIMLNLYKLERQEMFMMLILQFPFVQVQFCVSLDCFIFLIKVLGLEF